MIRALNVDGFAALSLDLICERGQDIDCHMCLLPL
jgi:hypothetical protein